MDTILCILNMKQALRAESPNYQQWNMEWNGKERRIFCVMKEKSEGDCIADFGCEHKGENNRKGNVFYVLKLKWLWTLCGRQREGHLTDSVSKNSHGACIVLAEMEGENNFLYSKSSIFCLLKIYRLEKDSLVGRVTSSCSCLGSECGGRCPVCQCSASASADAVWPAPPGLPPTSSWPRPSSSSPRRAPSSDGQSATATKVKTTFTISTWWFFFLLQMSSHFYYRLFTTVPPSRLPWAPSPSP